MWQTIHMFPLMAYLAVQNFVQNFKKDERAVSGIVVAVLLILVAVLAVVMLWGNLETWITTTWGKITQQGDSVG